MSIRKENASVEEVECRWDEESRVTRLPPKAAVGRIRRVLCNVECCRCRRSMFKRIALFFLSRPRKNFVFYNSPIIESDQLWYFFIFYREGHRLVKKLLLILCFVMNSIKILTWAGSMRRWAFFFFILKKISAPAIFGECSPVLLIGITIILLER